MKRIICIATISCLITTQAAFAGVDKDMKRFWEGSGGLQNATGATSLEAQSAGYYTLGSMYARTPVKNTQIASVTMPSIKAGCGGINMHNGGFSFLNSAEMTKTLKAISNNSSTFALQLSLETLSPVIARKVEELMTWMQRINQININSCETAASLVGGVWPRHERASQTICSTLANNSGIAADFAQSRHNCYADKEGTQSKIRSKNKELYDKLAVENVNLAWAAIKDSGLFGDLSSPDTADAQLAQLFMTLSGTLIIRGGDTPKYEFISGRMAHNDIIQALMDGGEIRYHKCDSTDKCLNISREGNNQTIKETDAFKSKIDKLMYALLSKVRNDEALTEEEKSFLNNKAQIPLYKILNVYSAYSGADALFELPVYTDAIATQMLFEYLNDVLRQVEAASDTLIIASDDHLKKFKENLRDVRMALSAREIKTHQTYSTLMKLVERATVIESYLANQVGSPIAESFNRSKEL